MECVCWRRRRMGNDKTRKMLMLPECQDVFSESGSVWVCTRSISFGVTCLFTLVVTVYACHRILPRLLSTGWYATNVVMLMLTALQMALLVYECLIENGSKILVVAKYVRALQVAVSCMLYGKLACDLLNRSRMYYQLLAPIVVITMVLLTVDTTAVVILEDSIDCHHISWLLSSMAGVILSASFALPGCIVLDEFKSASRKQQKFLSNVSSSVTELEQSHHQLWTLLVCNVISSVLQLLVDASLAYGVVGSVSCDSMFFQDGSGAMEQFVRWCISVLSYSLPNWATIYVFYILPRFQFSTALDVPAIGDDDSYELLLVDPDDDTVLTTTRAMLQ